MSGNGNGTPSIGKAKRGLGYVKSGKVMQRLGADLIRIAVATIGVELRRRCVVTARS